MDAYVAHFLFINIMGKLGLEADAAWV